MDRLVETYRRALALRPDDALTRANFGVCLLEMGERDAGEVSIRAAARGRPEMIGRAIMSLVTTAHGRFFMRTQLRLPSSWSSQRASYPELASITTAAGFTVDGVGQVVRPLDAPPALTPRSVRPSFPASTGKHCAIGVPFGSRPLKFSKSCQRAGKWIQLSW